MKVVFCGTGWFPIVAAIEARLPQGIKVITRSPDEPVALAVRDAEVVLPSNGRLDGDAIRGALRLRLIQQPASGYDGIDLSTARSLGVPVCNAPGTNGDSVAECALFLMLGLARRQKELERSFAGRIIGTPLGVELKGKRLVLIGRGRSGSALLRIAEAIGMEVLAFGKSSTRAEILEALGGADFVSLHCPLDDRTRHFFDDAAFSALKPGAFLINCARGPLIEREALLRALASGRLGGVGLDVYWAEPWDPNDALYASPNVLTLPHVGGSTAEAFARIADLVAGNIRRLIAGEPLEHRVA